MKLLKQINKNASQRVAIAEDAAGGSTSANSVAGGGMPLFASLVKRAKPAPAAAIVQEIARDDGPPAKKKSMGLKEAFTSLTEFADAAGMGDGQSDSARAEQKFDTTEVISKLKGLEHKEKADHRDTVTFGLEDDNGGLVRVIVKNEQAQDFEKALQAFMGDHEREEDELPEIAEILFKLKDRFDIVDVQWPEIQEDEEQDTALQGDPNADPAADPNAPQDPNAEDPNADLDAAPDDGAGEADVQGLLTQVIDMMKADAEARKADAQARQAEAKVKEADAIAAQAMARVKQEEQYLDMDTYNKSKKDESKEAKRLAQLAKWKHDMNKDQGGQGVESDNADSDLDNQASMGMGEPSAQPAPMQGVEQEERSGLRRAGADGKQIPNKGGMIRGRVHPHDVASFILSRVK